MLLGLTASVAVGAGIWLIRGFTLLVAAGVIIAAVSLVRGSRLPLGVRAFLTGMTLMAGSMTCLWGRTMEPQLTLQTAKFALIAFALRDGLPNLALLRLWRGRVRVLLVVGMFPACLMMAHAIASYEEYRFIQKHRYGVGPTARWTVSNHWLAYDATSQKLSGAD